MKTPLLLALLVASLALNAWLTFARSGNASGGSGSSFWFSAKAAAPAPREGAATAATATAAARNGVQPVVWNSPPLTNDGLRAFAAELRAAGVPPSVVVHFVGALLRDRTHAQIAELPFWQLFSPGPETRKLQSAAATELLRLQEEILGPSGSQVATLDPISRRQRYGNLPDAKIAALLRIERDYRDISIDLTSSYGGAITMEESAARREQTKAIEKEKLADIAAALTPEEYAEWELHGSGVAQRVQNALRNVTVSEQEYAALFAAQKQFDPSESSVFGIRIGSSMEDQTKAYALHDQVRATLGDQRFHDYLRASEPGYSQIASFAAKQGNLSPAQTYQLYRLQNEAQLASRQRSDAFRTAQSSGKRPDTAQIEKTFADLNTRLEAAIGPAAAAAYRTQGMGQVFRSFQPQPARPATPPATATPPKS